MARIAIGGMQHETNTFAPSKADYAAFEAGGGWPSIQRGDTLFEAVAGANIPVQGAIDALRARGHAMVPLTWAAASPSAQVTRDAFERIVGDLVARRALASLFDFENRNALFPGVHRSYKFCLLTLSGRPIDEAQFAFFAAAVDDLKDARRRFTLTPEDIARVNPNTRTVPIFRTRTDADLTRAIYRRVPVLVSHPQPPPPAGEGAGRGGRH